jgi:hypothetical protein
MSEQFTIYDATNVGKRVCGSCQLCCKVLPVKGLDKPGWTKCKHQRVGKGCMVYDRTEMPHECQLWSCRWLTGQDTADQARPDRSHYVIDVMPDMVVVVVDGQQHEKMVMQVWVDSGFPEAMHDPALRAYIERRGKADGIATVVRTSKYHATLVVPPCLSVDGKWIERPIITTEPKGSGNRFVDALAAGR